MPSWALTQRRPYAGFTHLTPLGNACAADETAVLGALRSGYRCFHLRSMMGTRIALCSLLVHLQLDEVPHLWAEAEVLRDQLDKQLVSLHAHAPSPPMKLAHHFCGDHTPDALA